MPDFVALIPRHAQDRQGASACSPQGGNDRLADVHAQHDGWMSLAIFALATLAAQGCGDRGQTVTNIPEAMVFEQAPEFAGEWVGEIGTQAGVLNIGELGAGRYYGAFRADVGLREYVLLMEQSTVETVGGGRVPSNRILFTWQDGQGARGRGWLLINREETALAGAFGLGDAHEGEGEWTFVRISE